MVNEKLIKDICEGTLKKSPFINVCVIYDEIYYMDTPAVNLSVLVIKRNIESALCADGKVKVYDHYFNGNVTINDYAFIIDHRLRSTGDLDIVNENILNMNDVYSHSDFLSFMYKFENSCNFNISYLLSEKIISQFPFMYFEFYLRNINLVADNPNTNISYESACSVFRDLCIYYKKSMKDIKCKPYAGFTIEIKGPFEIWKNGFLIKSSLLVSDAYDYYSLGFKDETILNDFESMISHLACRVCQYTLGDLDINKYIKFKRDEEVAVLLGIAINSLYKSFRNFKPKDGFAYGLYDVILELMCINASSVYFVDPTVYLDDNFTEYIDTFMNNHLEYCNYIYRACALNVIAKKSSHIQLYKIVKGLSVDAYITLVSNNETRNFIPINYMIDFCEASRFDDTLMRLSFGESIYKLYLCIDGSCDYAISELKKSAVIADELSDFCKTKFNCIDDFDCRDYLSIYSFIDIINLSHSRSYCLDDVIKSVKNILDYKETKPNAMNAALLCCIHELDVQIIVLLFDIIESSNENLSIFCNSNLQKMYFKKNWSVMRSDDSIINNIMVKYKFNESKKLFDYDFNICCNIAAYMLSINGLSAIILLIINGSCNITNMITESIDELGGE